MLQNAVIKNRDTETVQRAEKGKWRRDISSVWNVGQVIQVDQEDGEIEVSFKEKRTLLFQ